MNRTTLSLIALLLMLTVSAFAQINPAPTLLNFQGRLAKPDGTPVANGNYSLRFSLWTTLSGGVEKWNQAINPVAVKNGTFAVLLNVASPTDLFNADRWLEIKVGTDAPLTPRQQLVSVAFAMKANSVPDGSITSASIANGTITAADLAPNLLNGLSWLLGGNSGTNSNSNFIGTTDNQPLIFRTNNTRVLRLESVSDGTNYSGNVLGGFSGNFIRAGVIGGTVAGGGYFSNLSIADIPNSVTDMFGTVGGGAANTAGNGTGTTNDANYATVGGGSANTAGGDYATVGGGSNNTASGQYAVIPGGQNCAALANYTFAAGSRAKANHFGSFVWGGGDTAFDFASTAFNQFLIRAYNGVGINTNSPSHMLTIAPGYSSNALLRLIGPNSAYGWGARLNFGDGDYVYIEEDSDDNMTLKASNVRVLGTFVNASDARWKTNVTPLGNALDSILNLRGVTFDWKRENDLKANALPSGKQIGFIAQEVEKVLPELVVTDAKGYKSVSYINVVPILVEAVKTQQKQIDTLKAHNDHKDTEIAELKQQMTALMDAVRQLQTQQNNR